MSHFQKSGYKLKWPCDSGMRKPYRKNTFRPKDNSPSPRHFTHGNLLCLPLLYTCFRQDAIVFWNFLISNGLETQKKEMYKEFTKY